MAYHDSDDPVRHKKNRSPMTEHKHRWLLPEGIGCICDNPGCNATLSQSEAEERLAALATEVAAHEGTKRKLRYETLRARWWAKDEPIPSQAELDEAWGALTPEDHASERLASAGSRPEGG